MAGIRGLTKVTFVGVLTPRRLRTRLACALVIAATSWLAVPEASGAVIPVTTIYQKISSTGGCSLQEAIYSANFDSNLAIAGYKGSTPIVITTQCIPGDGDDIIVLPAGKVLLLTRIVDDADNPTGPTATPIITSKITILAYGATLQRSSGAKFRLFAVSELGQLTIRRAYIRGFHAQGGNGAGGGGGGMGAGGAIFIRGGALVVEASTFEANTASGGEGTGSSGSGGGGGIGGHGGGASGGGGGGGGARGNGGGGAVDGGGGGGTVSNGAGGGTRHGGFDCGGDGGSETDGHDGRCPGGGGGGGGDAHISEGVEFEKNGGDGHYGGGGGGGADGGNGTGGRGGFGGGGGSAHLTLANVDPGDGGDGGFGGGGGSGGGAIFNFNGEGGDGGFFAGNGGDGGGGGGGAGLGGAIFNHGGAVDIRNSTFAANAVGGGFSLGAQDGSGGGGAIFSLNGQLTILNSTISGNSANFGGGIIVAQQPSSAPTAFVLQNTIVAGNGQYECAITGSSVAVAFAHNLIQSNAGFDTEYHRERFVGCGDPLTTGDPQLGPLQYNQGPTPTMAIGSTSPAWNTGDPATSLPQDQRRQDRPAMGGFDIGAFELCLEGAGKLQQPCPVLVGVERPDQSPVQLTIDVQPAGSGITTPAPGTREVEKDSVIALTATAKPGFRFSDWSTNVTNPSDPTTTVFMNSSKTVIANFVLCSCASDVTHAIKISYGGVTLNPVTRRYVQTVTLKNNSTSAITGPISLVVENLTPNVTVYNRTGTTDLMLPAGSPYVNANVNLAAGQSINIQLQFVNPGNIPFTYAARVLAGPGSR